MLCLAITASGNNSFDVGAVAGHSTRDASRRPDGRCDSVHRVDASRPAARDPCPPPPAARTRSFESRFRLSDRLLWLVLRRLWPRWRDALVLLQPATVDRWHRERFHRCWRRRSRRPGRPRIDSECRGLIRRLAADNRLWGAPRIHGELLKLGIVVSERTVSRYLPDRRRAPSQTWRTFLANHLGQFTFISAEMSRYAPGGDDVVDGSGFWRDSGAVAQRSAGYVSVHVPVMRTVTTHSGRGFMVQARFAGDGSISLPRQ